MDGVIEQRLIDSDDNDYLARLLYQLSGYSNLIRHICQSGGADNTRYKKLLDRYQALNAEKEVLFKSVCERYAPEYMDDEHMITMSTNICALIVRKKVECGQCNQREK